MQRQLEFKRAFQKLERELKNLVWCLDCFRSASCFIGLLKKHQGEKEDWAASAFTKAFIVEYSKPFSLSKVGDSRRGLSLKFLKENQRFNAALSEQILDARNRAVAHSDAALEGQALQVLMAEVRPLDSSDTKVSAICVPGQIYLNSNSLLYLRLGPKLDSFIEHIVACEEVTHEKIKSTTGGLVKLLLSNADIAKALDAVHVYEAAEEGVIQAVGSEVLSVAEPESKFKMGEPNIKRKTIQVQHGCAEELSYDDDRYRIVLFEKKPSDQGLGTSTLKMNVEFKRYPRG